MLQAAREDEREVGRSAESLFVALAGQTNPAGVYLAFQSQGLLIHTKIVIGRRDIILGQENLLFAPRESFNTTPESLADYLIEVLRRAGKRFFSDVLDDACTARDFFATRVDCKKLGFLAEFDLSKVMKRGTRARSYGPGCRLILEHLSERCAANCLMGKTSNASRCSAFNDTSFD